MLLRDDVVADRKAKAGTFPGRFSGEEWLKQLVFDLRWDTDATVADSDFDHISEIARRHPQSRLEVRVASLLLALGGGIEAIAEQVEADAGSKATILWDWSEWPDKIVLMCCRPGRARAVRLSCD